MKFNYSHPVLWLLSGMLFSGCERYLDAVPNKSLALPNTLADVQALLENNGSLNVTGPTYCHVAADDFYFTSADYNSITEPRIQENYVWDPAIDNLPDWSIAYRAVGTVNEALLALQNIAPSPADEYQWRHLEASARFYRVYFLYQAAQQFAPPFNILGNNEVPGLPLPLSASLEQHFTRASVSQIYSFFTSELRAIANAMPAKTNIKTRPTQVSCLALLARIYLNMGAYSEAGQAAKASLAIQDSLLNYNQLVPGQPFPRYNREVLFHSTLQGLASFQAPRAKLDTNLWVLYGAADLRRTLFYVTNADGSLSFRGNYEGRLVAPLFNGLTTSECYLIAAESAARLGVLAEAADWLNRLRINRIRTSAYVPISFTSMEDAVREILAERRRELAFRGIRWQDLRRLNQEAAWAKTLVRNIDGNRFELLPNDPRYTNLIPYSVIDFNSGMPQNPR